jgi:membrane protein implicated in regulation of membrane protease activity
MPLNARPIALNFAVICFFGISFVTWLSGLAPFTCCKRAVAGAFFAYVTVVVAVKIINAILISAMVENQMRRQKELNSGGEG